MATEKDIFTKFSILSGPGTWFSTFPCCWEPCITCLSGASTRVQASSGSQPYFLLRNDKCVMYHTGMIILYITTKHIFSSISFNIYNMLHFLILPIIFFKVFFSLTFLCVVRLLSFELNYLSVYLSLILSYPHCCKHNNDIKSQEYNFQYVYLQPLTETCLVHTYGIF